MHVKLNFRLKLFAMLLSGLLLGATSESFQLAHAEEGWVSLLKPLVNSVIFPTVNNKIDQWAAKIEQKAASKANNPSATMSITGNMAPAPVSTPSSTNSDTITNDWQLPQEPVH